MSTFLVVPLNPLRFLPEVIDTPYSILPFDQRQTKKTYYQKFARFESIKIQVLSDFNNIIFEIVEIATGRVVKQYNVDVKPITVTNETFKVYETQINFIDLAAGTYYASIKYLDTTANLQKRLTSEAFSVADEWPGTIAIDYQNSENAFSVIFDTDIIFRLRIEGVIKKFTPLFDDVVYTDQVHNYTKLHSTPYRQEKLFLGSSEGMPEWMADKLNWAFACDMVQIDGQYYERPDGTKWDIIQADFYEFMALQLDVVPVNNKFLKRFKTNNPTTVPALKHIELDTGSDVSYNSALWADTGLTTFQLYNPHADFPTMGSATRFCIGTVLMDRLFGVGRMELTMWDNADKQVRFKYERTKDDTEPNWGPWTLINTGALPDATFIPGGSPSPTYINVPDGCSIHKVKAYITSSGSTYHDESRIRYDLGNNRWEITNSGDSMIIQPYL